MVKIEVVSVFTALALATNYAMIDIPNVKLMDALVFIASFLFGLRVGLGSAVSIWIVYGFFNPYGQADPTTFVFVTLGECLYAVSGAVLSRASTARDILNNGHWLKRSSVFGLIGFQATFAYDVLTNFGSWLFRTSSLYQAFIIGMVTGAPFSVLHEASNLIFFATVVPLALAASKRAGFTIHGRDS